MKLPKMDFSKIAKETAGNAVGLVLINKINKIKQIAAIEKPTTKGLLTLAIGKLVIPMVANMAGLKDKKTADFVSGISEGIGTYGLLQIASGNDATKDLFPKIGGYEESPYRSLGMVVEEDNGMSGVDGYEQQPYRSLAD